MSNVIILKRPAPFAHSILPPDFDEEEENLTMNYADQRPGYRPRSLTARDNYGLSPEGLVAYLQRHGCTVSPELKRIIAERASRNDRSEAAE